MPLGFVLEDNGSLRWLPWWHADGATLGDTIEAIFRFVLFEVPAAYGLEYGRPIWFVFFLWIALAACYSVAILTKPWSNRNYGGIYKVVPKESIAIAAGHPVIADGSNVERLHESRLWVAHFYALWFSLLSALHIGWRDLNAGIWLTRLQSTEFTLRAYGWARVLSGLQSLVSIYLVALWALTYFGRLFE